MQVDVAEFWGTIAEVFLWGLGLVLWLLYLFMWFKPTQGRDFDAIFVAIFVLFLMSSAHAVMNVLRLAHAYELPVPGGSLAYYSAINTMSLATDFLFGLVAVLADLVLIGRLWAIWDRSFVVIAFPFILLVATQICAVETWMGQRKIQANPTDVSNLTSTLHWATAGYFLIFINNAILSIAIGLRIWYIGRRSIRKWHLPILVAFVESGALMTSTLAVGFVLYVLQSNAQPIIHNTTPIISTIAPLLLVVQLKLRSNSKVGDSFRPQATTMEFATRVPRAARRPLPSTTQLGTFETLPDDGSLDKPRPLDPADLDGVYIEGGTFMFGGDDEIQLSSGRDKSAPRMGRQRYDGSTVFHSTSSASNL